MEWEKIIYFYPLAEYVEKTGCMPAAKRYWFQDALLKFHLLYEKDDVQAKEGTPGAKNRAEIPPAEFQVIGCGVPPYYYRHRYWKPQALSEAMETVVYRVEGMADTWIHPQIETMLTEEYAGRWIPRADTVQAVTKRLIERYTGGVLCRSGGGISSGVTGAGRDRSVTNSGVVRISGSASGICGEVTVLLGEPADTDRQMQMTRELLLPYLPRINRLLIFYEEVAETDIWMELGSHLDEYYYEYGLVPQLEPYVRNCGKAKCRGMILDYCEQFRYPKIEAESAAVYIDVQSVSAKEKMLERKMPRIPYISPLKYLDTMVKNSYDG
ncbi:MAG: hypothetical protein NC416_09305 [Eubacterium sp.]|nr:hypothetical protein [Eubacterium sp.]